MNIIYREAEKCDAEGLILHMKTVGGETDNLSFGENTFNISTEKEAKFIEKFRNNPGDIMIVALLGDRVIGNASLMRNRTARYSHRAELSITVIKEYWGQGVGSRLMEMLIEFAKKKGLASIYLEVRSDNLRAIRLYQKYGFEKIGTYRGFFKIGEEFHDADFMRLELLRYY